MSAQKVEFSENAPQAMLIAIGAALVGCLWIFLSNGIVAVLVSRDVTLYDLPWNQITTGVLVILPASFLLYALIKKKLDEVSVMQRPPGWAGKNSGQALAGKRIKNTDDFARLNEHVPLKGADDKRSSLVSREAILDRAEKIAGYEFSLLTTLQARLHHRGGMARRAYDSALLARLSLHGVTSLLGHRIAFVNLAAESLSDSRIDELPPQNTVLMLDLASEFSAWGGLTAQLADLKQKGFSSGLTIQDVADTACPLMHDLDFVQINVTAFNGIDLQALTRKLKTVGSDGTRPPRLVARDVQSHDDFQFCVKIGFDLFQGPFITSRESLRPATGGINRMVALPILRMVRSDENFALIAKRLRNEPTLSYKLLRYLNSPAIGLQTPIDNLTQALVLLGREKFYRWMSLLFFDFAKPTYRERALSESALTRGRTLELLAGKGHVPNAPDHLFLIGLFSLLDVALSRPLPELIESATLPDVVRDTLLGKASAYADALTLAILGEANDAADPDQMAQALECCGLTAADFTPAAVAALVWANEAIGDAM